MIKPYFHYAPHMALKYPFILDASIGRYKDGAFAWAGIYGRLGWKYFSFGIENDRTRKQKKAE